MMLQLTISRKNFWSHDAHEPIMKLVAIAAGLGEVTLGAVGEDIIVTTGARRQEGRHRA